MEPTVVLRIAGRGEVDGQRIVRLEVETNGLAPPFLYCLQHNHVLVLRSDAPTFTVHEEGFYSVGLHDAMGKSHFSNKLWVAQDWLE